MNIAYYFQFSAKEENEEMESEDSEEIFSEDGPCYEFISAIITLGAIVLIFFALIVSSH